jgi:hypothetical protein
MAITKTVAGLYTTDGTTLTQVATTAEVASGLCDTANTRYAPALVPATVIVNPGQVYYIAYLVNASTAGSHQGWVKATNVVARVAADGPPPVYTLAGQTSLPATQAISGLTAVFDLVPRVGLGAA